MFNLFSTKKKEVIFPFQVDLHSHLLPDLDDGVKSINESIYVLKNLQKLGYRKVITTPHVMSDHYQNETKDIIEKLKVVQKALKKNKIEIELEAAAEYYLDEKFIEKLNSDERLLTLGKNYLLFETSFFNKPVFLEEAIFNMNTQGYQPVLAHPERYGYLNDNKKLIDKLKNMSVLFQLNLLSLTDFYSKDVRKFAKKLLKAKLIDFVGTDCHNAMQINEIKNNIDGNALKLLKDQRLLNHSLLTLH